MMRTDPLIDALVAELHPVAPISARQAWATLGGVTLVAMLFVAWKFGLREDVLAGRPAPMVMLRTGALLVLGCAAMTAVIASARPAVGQNAQGWRWALAMAALFPMVALLRTLGDGAFPETVLYSPSGKWCLMISFGGALLIGGSVTAWLRRGAPVAIDRVSWLVGLAAGSFGTCVYSLHCPSETVHYIGLWYTSAIALSAVAARLMVPRLIRW